MARIDLGLVKGPTGPTGATGPQGPQGVAGKSAYAAAVDGGYTGTEGEFNANLADISDLTGGTSGQVLVSTGSGVRWATVATGQKYGSGKGQISSYELAMMHFNPYYLKARLS